jgi:hypothetical protein
MNAAAGTIQHWAVGVTTAPREHSTLAVTLASLAQAGWREPRLFVEPDVELPTVADGLPRSQRDARLGAFPNFYLGLAELVLRDPQTDAYLMCQDDILLAAGTRSYLEKLLWPADEVGVVSLFCASHLARGRSQGFYRDERGWQAFGAQAYVFPPDSARRLLTTPSVLEHRVSGPAEGRQNIDAVVGQWCRCESLGYYIHEPSLVQHIGETSTLYPTARATGRRRASQFLECVPTVMNRAGP